MELSHSYIAEYVKRVKMGDSDAFAELYNMTYQKVYNYARHYLHDDFLAQDAVQEVFINALRNIDKLADPTLFIAWINQISFHVCYDMAKDRKIDVESSDTEILEEICDSGTDSNPEESYVDSEEKKRLREAIDSLPENEKQLVTLRFYKSMKIDDIVITTGISRSTVKRQLGYALEKIKKRMRE